MTWKILSVYNEKHAQTKSQTLGEQRFYEFFEWCFLTEFSIINRYLLDAYSIDYLQRAGDVEISCDLNTKVEGVTYAILVNSDYEDIFRCVIEGDEATYDQLPDSIRRCIPKSYFNPDIIDLSSPESYYSPKRIDRLEGSLINQAFI